MKLNMNDASNFIETYSSIKDIPMPFKTGYKLLKLSKLLDAEQSFYREKVQALIEEYGEKDELGNFKSNNDGNIRIKADKIDECNQAFIELNEMEIEIDVDQYLFDIEELEKFDFTQVQLNSLIPFIK